MKAENSHENRFPAKLIDKVTSRILMSSLLVYLIVHLSRCFATRRTLPSENIQRCFQLRQCDLSERLSCSESKILAEKKQQAPGFTFIYFPRFN